MRSSLIGLTVLLLLSACSAAGSGTPAGSKPSSAGTALASRGQAPAAGTTANDLPGQWDQLLAAAKQERQVVVSGPANSLWRDQLVSFQKANPDVAVDYTGADSRDFWPRLQQERQAEKYLWDVRIGGPDPQVYAAVQQGVLDPVRSLLILPEVADEKKWAGGWQAFYADKAKQYLPGFLANISRPIYVNRDLAPEPQMQTEQDLLDPRYKGKIVLQDPRGGAGLAFLTTFLKVDGEAFVRALLNQSPVISGDNRQIAEWLVRGNYPIAIGARNYDLLPFQQQGLGKNVKAVEGVKALPLSIGSGGIQLINRAPHPSARQLFINWLLTAQVQTALTQAIQQNSLRVDVPPALAEEMPRPELMDQYVNHQSEELLPLRQQAVQLAAEVLK